MGQEHPEQMTAREVHASLHKKLMSRPSFTLHMLHIAPDVPEDTRQIFERGIKQWEHLDHEGQNYFEIIANAINGVAGEGWEEVASLYQELLKVLEG